MSKKEESDELDPDCRAETSFSKGKSPWFFTFGEYEGMDAILEFNFFACNFVSGLPIPSLNSTGF